MHARLCDSRARRDPVDRKLFRFHLHWTSNLRNRLRWLQSDDASDNVRIAVRRALASTLGDASVHEHLQRPARRFLCPRSLHHFHTTQRQDP